MVILQIAKPKKTNEVVKGVSKTIDSEVKYLHFRSVVEFVVDR